MTLRGRIENGVVLLEGESEPSEGASVSVRMRKNSRRKAGTVGRTLYDRLKPFIGILNHLPPDFSINHDHYLYGAPKRK